MSQEELQQKYDRLIDRVRRMRGRQKEYFKYRASSDLEAARRLEREVDKLLNEEVKAQQSKQNSLL